MSENNTSSLPRRFIFITPHPSFHSHVSLFVPCFLPSVHPCILYFYPFSASFVSCLLPLLPLSVYFPKTSSFSHCLDCFLSSFFIFFFSCLLPFIFILSPSFLTSCPFLILHVVLTLLPSVHSFCSLVRSSFLPPSLIKPSLSLFLFVLVSLLIFKRVNRIHHTFIGSVLNPK